MSFVDSATYKRILNNSVVYGYAFKYHGDDLQTSSLTTHPLELQFGNIRDTSSGNDTLELALNCIAKTLIRDDIMNQLGGNKSIIRGRCNIAGSSTNDVWNIDIPDTIHMENISNEIISIGNKELTKEQFLQTNCWKLTLFLKENAPTIIPHIYGTISGSRIQTRLRNYSSNK